jgi:patatin-like phospholipase/acyl hydrolase
MRQLRLKMNPDSDDDDAPLAPCDHFNLICGTSTGGIIAIMLGRLRMTVEECIDAYLALSKVIFTDQKSFPGVRKLAGGAQYAASAMEENMKAIIKSKTGDPEAKMRDPLKKACCKTFVVATARDYADAPPFKLRTYSTEEYPADNCTIWQAARATSAATTFFEPVTFGVPKVTYIVCIVSVSVHFSPVTYTLLARMEL